MRRIDGIVPSDIPPYTMAGWLFDAAPEEQRTLERESVRVLARLHDAHARAPTTSRSSTVRSSAPSALDQHLDYQRWYYDWAREGQTVPLIERTFAALDETRPDGRPDRPQLGRQPHRQHDVPRLRAGRGARLGDGRARAGRDRRGLDDLPAPLLRGPDPQVRHAVPRRLPAARRASPRSTPRSRAARCTTSSGTRCSRRSASPSCRSARRWRTVAYGDAEAPDDLDDVIMFRSLLEEMVERAEAS